MTQSLYLVAGFVLLLALVPFGIKWIQSRMVGGTALAGSTSRVLSAVAVGPQQRVVTVEVGSADARICLVLGVTQQSIACLHSFPAGASSVVPGQAGGASPMAGGRGL